MLIATHIPLYILAEQKKLPLNQYMDRDTLAWIKNNKPKYLKEPTAAERTKLSTAANETSNIIKLYIPLQKRYFARNNANLSLHGELHAYRVALLAGVIASCNNEPSTNEYVIAGLFHDIARLNDQLDEGHGERSAVWLMKNKNVIKDTVDAEIYQRILTAISSHEKSKTNNVDSILTTTIQVADALDRFRLPKIKWWPNTELMPYTPSDLLLSFAFSLVVESERKMLLGNTPRDAFLKSVSELTKDINI